MQYRFAVNFWTLSSLIQPHINLKYVNDIFFNFMNSKFNVQIEKQFSRIFLKMKEYLALIGSCHDSNYYYLFSITLFSNDRYSIVFESYGLNRRDTYYIFDNTVHKMLMTTWFKLLCRVQLESGASGKCLQAR